MHIYDYYYHLPDVKKPPVSTDESLADSPKISSSVKSGKSILYCCALYCFRFVQLHVSSSCKERWTSGNARRPCSLAWFALSSSPIAAQWRSVVFLGGTPPHLFPAYHLTVYCVARVRLGYFAVFDGHGGSRAALYAAKCLHCHIVLRFPRGRNEGGLLVLQDGIILLFTFDYCSAYRLNVGISNFPLCQHWWTMRVVWVFLNARGKRILAPEVCVNYSYPKCQTCHPALIQ